MSLNFSLFGNRYYFTPKFTIVYLLLIMLFCLLGVWQWQSAVDIEQTIDLINKRLLQDPLQLDALDKGGDWRFYPVQLQGTFDDDHQILLINRLYKGQMGFQVLTPFKPTGSPKQILVNRGWLAGSPDKNTTLNTVTTPVTIAGVLFQPINHFTLHADFTADAIQWPLLSRGANIEKLSKALNVPLYPYLLLLSPNSQYGYTREWLWLTNAVEPARHMAYARQWFVLALTVLIIFVFMNMQRGEKL